MRYDNHRAARSEHPPSGRSIVPRSRILGTGHYVPDKVLHNRDLESVVDTSDEWISSRTGIRERRIAGDDQASSDMAAEAGRRALAAAGLSTADLDLIIVGTVTPDSPVPGCAVHVQRKLGATDIPAFDIAAACAGFVFGLNIADQFIATGSTRCVLVIGVELLSRAVDWTDRSTCVLFGDGAGAVVVGPASLRATDEATDAEPPRGLLACGIYTDGSHVGALDIPAGGTAEPYSPGTIENRRHKVHMVGQDVFRNAVKNLTSCSAQTLKDSGLTSADLDWVVAHQANLRIIQKVASRLGFPMDKFVINIDSFGNTSSASVPIALDQAIRDGRVKERQTVLMCALGAGLSWGAAVVRL